MSFGFGEILLVVLVVLIVFGAGKLPAVMGDLAKGVKNFKKGLNEEDETKPAEKQKAE
ncbi:MAG: twin-arginine translocase TatA/TatE family subunit [Proteobacteria bacterium]|nr:twin-arginine translocase TatA/TatE family subunit [Pseudomonadota bacterium]